MIGVFIIGIMFGFLAGTLASAVSIERARGERADVLRRSIGRWWNT